FSAVSDVDVARLLRRLPIPPAADATVPPAEPAEENEVSIPILGPELASAIVGDVGAPNEGREPHGLVILAHGGGSSRQSYRNRYLAGRLRMAGWSTLRVDLLTEPEQQAD